MKFSRLQSMSLMLVLLSLSVFPWSGQGAEQADPNINQGLVAHYQFNGNGDDSSGNGNHATLVDVSFASGISSNDKAAVFDGTTSWGEVDHSSSISVGTSQTLALWLKIADYPESGSIDYPQITGDIIAQKGDGNSDNESWVIRLLPNGAIGYGWRNPNASGNGFAWRIPNYAFPKSEWLHLVIRHDNTFTPTITVNGQILATEGFGDQSNPLYEYRGNMSFGADLRTQPFPQFNGSIASFKIYNRALSSTEVDALYASESQTIDSDGDGLKDSVETGTGTFVSVNNTGTNPDNPDSDGDGVPDGLEVSSGTDPNDAQSFNSLNQGLVAHYQFNGNANDVSGNGNNGTAGDATAVADRFGNPGSAYDFRNASVGVTVPHNESLNASSAGLTLSAWVKVDSNSSGGSIIMKGDSAPNSYDYGLRRRYGSPHFVWASDGLHLETETAALDISDDSWHHVLVTHTSGSEIRIYVDGILDFQTFRTEPRTLYGKALTIGYNTSIGSPVGFFQGLIDDVRIYNRTLSSSEVSALYASESPYLPAPPSPHLANFYESNPNQSLSIDATPTNGYPQNFTYQWYLNGFAISSTFGGTASTYVIDGTSSFEGNWRVVVSNSEGSATNDFTYRVFVDTDSDGLSDGREEIVTGTNPNKADSDDDGLSDLTEVNVTLTNPLKPDSDGDGLSDGVESNTGVFTSETNTGTNPNNADSDGDSVPDGLEVSSETDPNNNQSFDSFNQGLVAYYPLNGNANDESGNGKSGSVSPSGATSAVNRFNDPNSSMQFDGLQGFVSLPQITDVDPGDNKLLSVSFWALDANGAIVSQYVQGNRSESTFLISLGASGISVVGDGLDMLTKEVVQDSEVWNHWVVILQGDKQSFYKNGVLLGDYSSLTYNQNSASSDWFIGKVTGTPSQLLSGTVDDIRIYDRALSSAEVASLYASETPAVPALLINPFYESASGQSVTVDATPAGGNPTDFGYQWYFQGSPISSIFGGTSPAYTIDGTAGNNGSWKVVVTNSTGSTEANFSYYVIQDSDGDGLSDGKENVLYGSDPMKKDTDEDGLDDFIEATVHLTNPTLKDTDSDGFEDRYELTFGGDPKDAQSLPGGVMTIQTAVEVRFHGATGVTYKIQYSPDFSNWQDVETGIQGTGTRIDRLFSAQDYPKRFFRVVQTSP